MHRDDIKDLGRFLATIVGLTVFSFTVVGGIVVGVELAFGERSCIGRWGDRGSWSLFGGCVVQTENGVVPEDIITFGDLNVRERP